ncbi:TonB-dependent receptor domain-containing protein [Sphingobium aromaticiconvertens]|uniref:TonB-dependent receptor domain-containing protein n=1 Tax=Sphingobium aromaticiconvertens TaxID=365341 RepID=UPI003015DA3E
MKRGIASLLPLACIAGTVHAQTLPLENGIRFSLKPHPGLRPSPQYAYSRMPARIDPIDPIDADDRVQEIRIGLQRTTRHFSDITTATPFAPHALSRSRMTRYMVEDRLPIGDHVVASFGWHGIKVSNRNANVTVGMGSERLRTRDWFLPRATLAIQPGRDLRLTVGYDERLRAYGETGTGGPMGLTRDAFLSLSRNLKPETQSRMHVRADWAATAVVDLSFALQGGRLDDQLSFVGRGTLPVNSGSARIEGAVLEAQHRMTPHLSWTLRYSHARVRGSGGDRMHERSLRVGSVWQDGPWRAALSIVRNSAPALVPDDSRALLVEAGVDYVRATSEGRPLTLSVHMTDPDRLASGRFMRDDLSGPLYAADQVRAVMASARLGW